MVYMHASKRCMAMNLRETMILKYLNNWAFMGCKTALNQYNRDMDQGLIWGLFLILSFKELEK